MPNNIDDFYNKILNIRKMSNIAEKIGEIVTSVKKEILNYTTDYSGLCKLASHNISDSLNNLGIQNKVINTRDLFGNEVYEHEFIICYFYENGMNYVLIDATFSQFVFNGKTLNNYALKKWPSKVLSASENGQDLLEQLLEKGYTFIDNQKLKLYFNSFGINCHELTIESLLESNQKKL